jgi:hypothetical protein
MKSFFSLFLFISIANIAFAQTTLSDGEILNLIQKNKPLNGAKVPKNIKDIIGATHVGGKYNFTKESYLLEGCKKMYELGLGVCKLWFYKNQTGYMYNSDSNFCKVSTLKEMAEQSVFKQAFDIPFSTFVLSTSANQTKMLEADSLGLVKEELEYFELTSYLLDKYKNRAVNFILENWEGDWIVRGGVGWDAQWGRVDPPNDIEKKFKSLQLVFKARQNGVNRARVLNKNSQCKVYHAIEVNKVIDAMYGVPSIANNVLPFVDVDMVSWSAYDATDFDKTGIDLYKGIEYIKSKMNTGLYTKEKIVFLGEIGIPEMATKNLPKEFRERWDTYLAVCLLLKVPYFIQWELYCNEPAKGAIINYPNMAKSNTDMNGFWLIRQDGTKSYVMSYFDELINNAGKYIKK